MPITLEKYVSFSLQDWENVQALKILIREYQAFAEPQMTQY